MLCGDAGEIDGHTCTGEKRKDGDVESHRRTAAPIQRKPADARLQAISRNPAEHEALQAHTGGRSVEQGV
jgi:hypothetical protein